MNEFIGTLTYAFRNSAPEYAIFFNEDLSFTGSVSAPWNWGTWSEWRPLSKQVARARLDARRTVPLFLVDHSALHHERNILERAEVF